MFNFIKDLAGKPIWAERDADGNIISETYLKKADSSSIEVKPGFGINIAESENNVIISSNDRSRVIHHDISNEVGGVTVNPVINAMNDYGVINNSINAFIMNIPDDKLTDDDGNEFLLEVGMQFKVADDMPEGALQVTLLSQSNRAYTYSNWPETFTPGSTYQMTIVNTCISIAEFVTLKSI